MNDKEKRYTQELERCRANINKTKSRIDYHKGMLKIFENKEAEIMARLSETKMHSLCEMINKSGYDIDLLREAVRLGDFSSIINVKKETIKDEAEAEKTVVAPADKEDVPETTEIEEERKDNK